MSGTDGSSSGVVPAGLDAVGRVGPEDEVDMARPVLPGTVSVLTTWGDFAGRTGAGLFEKPATSCHEVPQSEVPP
jgi:hypothetical protein